MRNILRVTDIDRNQCSGCNLCQSICPLKCIKMVPDKKGYLFPQIDDDVCINCGKCYNSCPMISEKSALTMPISTYAAARRTKANLKKSSSGGVFASIAETVLNKDGWVVVGCKLNSNLEPVHAIINTPQDLYKLYGSKYVHSYMGGLYSEVADYLQKGIKVLFSGTPCQVAAIQKYTHNHALLYTIEVICHGVPNAEMFESYLNLFDKEQIKDFVFRDKNQGWSFNNLIIYANGNQKRINHRMSSYMTYFLNGETYRDSCYQCPFACEKRGADITIGDFWGVIRTNPDLQKLFDIENGVSCLLVDTEKGADLLKDTDLKMRQVPYDDIRNGNEPLNHPSNHSNKRSSILKVWEKKRNWADVDSYWKKNDRKVIHWLWSYIPIELQHKIRVLLRLR